jgi:hypothetical protein
VNKLPTSAIFNFTDDDEYPVALKLFIGGQISIETLRIIDDRTPIIDQWSLNTAVQNIWSNELLRVKKLTGFVKYDKIKLKMIFTHFMEEIAE